MPCQKSGRVLRRRALVCYYIKEHDISISLLQTSTLLFGGLLKSMLASDIAIIDIEEYQIKHLKVVIKLL